MAASRRRSRPVLGAGGTPSSSETDLVEAVVIQCFAALEAGREFTKSAPGGCTPSALGERGAMSNIPVRSGGWRVASRVGRRGGGVRRDEITKEVADT